jgi:serine/threonine-protein kinase
MSDLPRAFGGYVLLKVLGTGVSGDVFLARPREPRPDVPSPVVIKRLHPELVEDRAFALRFKQEAQIAIAVSSPFVAKLYDVGRVGSTFYMAIEYIPGWTLSRVIADLRDSGTFASFSSIRDILGDALDGLTALHTAVDPASGTPLNVVHRDIAPKNMILGEDSVTRLIDLGIGKSAYQDWRTNTGVVVGSPGYMSPEQATGREVDRRSDIYGMGLILWELLTSQSYIERAPVPVMLRAQASPNYRSPSMIRQNIPQALEEIVARALAREPADRFDTAAEMKAALHAAIGPRVEEKASSTIVGALLWGELGESKTEITVLLSSDSGPVVVPVDEDSDDTMVFAERYSSSDGSDGSEDSGGSATPPISIIPAMSAPPVSVVVERGLPLTWVLGLMSLTLAVGILIAVQMFLPAKPTGVDLPVEPVEKTAPPVVPVASPVAKEEPAPPPSKVEPEIEKTEKPVEVEREGRRKSKRDRRAAVEPRAATDPEDRLQRLIDRARAVRNDAPEDSARAREAQRLMTELNAEMGRREVDDAAVDGLEARLRRLEKNR